MEFVAAFDMLEIKRFVDKLVASGTPDSSRLSRTHVFRHCLLSFLNPLLIGSSRPSVCIRWAPVKYIKTTFHQRRLTTSTVGSQLFKVPIVQQVESSTMLTRGDNQRGNMKIEDNTAKNCRSSSPS